MSSTDFDDWLERLENSEEDFNQSRFSFPTEENNSQFFKQIDSNEPIPPSFSSTPLSQNKPPIVTEIELALVKGQRDQAQRDLIKTQKKYQKLCKLLDAQTKSINVQGKSSIQSISLPNKCIGIKWFSDRLKDHCIKFKLSPKVKYSIVHSYLFFSSPIDFVNLILDTPINLKVKFFI